jgi:hypothetical protein
MLDKKNTKPSYSGNNESCHAMWFVEEIIDRFEDASKELQVKHPRIGKLPRQRATPEQPSN